jgi:hypothetical protein
VMRFLVGFGIGGEAGAGATLVAEAFPEALRIYFSLLLFTCKPASPPLLYTPSPLTIQPSSHIRATVCSNSRFGVFHHLHHRGQCIH